ncbi:methionine ABC transporter ATP-binding protein [Chitinimonas lacunae]|uniref:Methionine ABC transporter ATP-binding protein n=1 Tax=Chitinimonas lacunae TaxID=1963018 RepID=A0ABV8MQR5_9NEIS
MIRIEHLNKTYPVAGRPLLALDDINLDIGQGEIYGLIGRSGAGKSSLLRTLNLLERPDSGRILVDGEDITRLDAAGLRRYRRQVGMVFQHFNLLGSQTVAANIRLPLELAGELDRAAIDRRIDELLDWVGLTERRDHYPAQLSGGQKQRVGIARALANRPRLLLCDEATSALDPQTTRSILTLLLEINRRLGLTVVLVSHEIQVVQTLCDRIAVLEAGRVVEQGRTADLLLKPAHAATRSLVAESGLIAEPPPDLALPSAGLLRLTFTGAHTYQPLLASVARTLDIAFNIVQGQVGRIKDTPYGQLIVAVEGHGTALGAARRAFQSQGIHCEELA